MNLIDRPALNGVKDDEPIAAPEGGASGWPDAWLDDQEAERDALIMRLRQIEKNLIRYGRLRRGTLPPKVRQ